MKVSKEKIYKNLMLSAVLRPGAIRGSEKFYLVGYVPVEIIWSGGKKEISTIINMVGVSFFESIRHFMGAVAEKKKFENELKNKWIKELVEKLEIDFMTLDKTKKLNGKKIKSIKVIPISKWFQATQQKNLNQGEKTP